MARNGPEEQRKADANRGAKAARQEKQRARDDARRAEDEKNRRALESRRLSGRNGPQDKTGIKRGPYNKHGR